MCLGGGRAPGRGVESHGMHRTATHMGMRMFSGQKLSAATKADASSVAAAI